MQRRSVILSASEERLFRLIAQRLEPGADKEVIDQRIWDLFGEEWCIMFTDLAGFSREVARFGIIHFLQTIYESERILIPLIESHDGIMLKVEGDSFLVIFRSVPKAIHAAIEMQRALHQHNRTRSDEERVLLCIGLGFGRVLRIGDTDVFGAEVNAASKLGEDVARPYEILVTDGVRGASNLDPAEFEEIANVPPGAEKAFRLRYSV
ncbi:MAG TPA: adenylate/guanylate cyclase domain-containing protein [Thermoanaerobaculia bacterium]|nr:adenylate/guanylate cyclase domain-containing protein [Thermoanaerobaculia bacterium]